MNPWQAIWAPNVNFPWSGSVEQKIEPNTNWFFDSIDVNAGDPRIEKKAFEKASYGRQIGLITEVVLALASESKNIEISDKSPLGRLIKIKAAIDEIKVQEAAASAAEIEDRLRWLKKNNREKYDLLSIKLLEILNDIK